jgi:phosphate transport system substrate-binding protein
MLLKKRLAKISIATSALLLIAAPAFAGSINGSGATFAAPLVDACKVDFAAETGHTVNYSGGGSGKGRSDFTGNLVDFANSDAPYSSGEPSNLVYVPAYAAPIAIMYNLPTVKEPIYLSPASIAKIFSGYITNWNDKALAKDNERTVKTPVFQTKKVTVKDKNGKMVTKTVPVLDKKGKPVIKKYNTKTVNIDLPNQPITVWYRTDSSGTSENFTRFLRGANAATGNSSLWPKAQNTTFANGTPNNISTFFNFQGASGSAANAAGVAKTVGGITYSELSFALDNKLPVAYVQNAAGEFVAPNAAGTSAFLGGGTIKDNGTVDVDFAKKIPGAYPIGTTSYALAYVSGKNSEKQAIVKQFLTYMLDKCPTKHPEKGFAQITGPLYDKAKQQIAKIK